MRIHFIENMTQRQIVDVLGMTPAFVSPRMRRAIVALKGMRDYGNTGLCCSAFHYGVFAVGPSWVRSVAHQ